MKHAVLPRGFPQGFPIFIPRFHSKFIMVNTSWMQSGLHEDSSLSFHGCFKFYLLRFMGWLQVVEGFYSIMLDSQPFKKSCIDWPVISWGGWLIPLVAFRVLSGGAEGHGMNKGVLVATLTNRHGIYRKEGNKLVIKWHSIGKIRLAHSFRWVLSIIETNKEEYRNNPSQIEGETKFKVVVVQLRVSILIQSVLMTYLVDEIPIDKSELFIGYRE